MKKFSLIIIALCLAFVCHSQTVSSTQGVYSVDNPNDTIPFETVKALSYNTNYKLLAVRLSQINESYRFYLFKKGDSAPVFIDLPSGYQLFDFDILEDSVYFAVKDSNIFYIGYFSIQDMITKSLEDNVQIKYSQILAESDYTDMSRLKAYKNSDGERIVAAIGIIINYAEPRTLDINPILVKPVWTYPPAYLYESLMICKIQEQSIPIQDTGFVIGNTNDTLVNEISFYRDSLSYSNNIYVNPEHFHDLTVTDDYLCIVSSALSVWDSFYYHITVTDSVKLPASSERSSDMLILRSLNKHTFEPHLSKFFYIKNPTTYHKMLNSYGGFKARFLHDNQFMLAYIFGEEQYARKIHYVVDGINILSDKYDIIWSLKENSLFSLTDLLIDLNVNNHTQLQMVALLKNSIENGYELQRFNPASSPSTRYAGSLETWNPNIMKNPFTFKSLVYNTYISIFGIDYSSEFKLLLFDKNLLPQSTSCYTQKSLTFAQQYDTQSTPNNISNLKKCTFYHPVYFKVYQPNGMIAIEDSGNEYRTYKLTRIHSIPTVLKKGGEINEICK